MLHSHYNWLFTSTYLTSCELAARLARQSLWPPVVRSNYSCLKITSYTCALPVTFFYIQARRFLAGLHTRSIFSSWELVLLLIYESTPAIVGVSDNNHSGWAFYLHPLIARKCRLNGNGRILDCHYVLHNMCDFKITGKIISHVIRGFIIRARLLPKDRLLLLSLRSDTYSVNIVIIANNNRINFRYDQCVVTCSLYRFNCLLKIYNSMIVDYLYF